jgi:hypothetical protein
MGQGRQRRDEVARFSCRLFAANAVRLQLHALAYNLGNFLRTLATPEPIKDRSLTSLREKPIKIGAKVVSHGRYVAFQMAEVAIPRNLFADILRLIAERRPPPVGIGSVGRPSVVRSLNRPPQRLRLVETVGNGQGIGPAGSHRANAG